MTRMDLEFIETINFSYWYAHTNKKTMRKKESERTKASHLELGTILKRQKSIIFLESLHYRNGVRCRTSLIYKSKSLHSTQAAMV